MGEIIDIGLNSSHDPFPEYHIVRDMLVTLYEKCDEFDKKLKEAEDDFGGDSRSAVMDVNSAGLDTISIYDATERYLALAIASLYERVIRGYLSQLSNLDKVEPLPQNSIFKGVKERLEVLKVDDFFKKDLLTSWDVLIKIRNIYCHSFRLDPKSKSNLKILSGAINSHGLSNLITCNSSNNQLYVSRSFYERCLDDFIVIVTKFEIMLGECHAFESYVMNADGYIYEELNNMTSVVE